MEWQQKNMIFPMSYEDYLKVTERFKACTAHSWRVNELSEEWEVTAKHHGEYLFKGDESAKQLLEDSEWKQVLKVTLRLRPAVAIPERSLMANAYYSRSQKGFNFYGQDSSQVRSDLVIAALMHSLDDLNPAR